MLIATWLGLTLGLAGLPSLLKDMGFTSSLSKLSIPGALVSTRRSPSFTPLVDRIALQSKQGFMSEILGL